MMTEQRERSGIFKAIYVFLAIITFPIYAVLFILRHPLWVLFVLLLLAGGVVYYPINQGVKPEEVIDWYKKKYTDAQIEVVAKAKEKGVLEFVPQNIQREAKEIEIKALDDKLEKGENYNDMIVRDEKMEEKKVELKKRGGFKSRKKEIENNKERNEDSSKAGENVMDVLTENANSSTGLSLLIKKADESEKIEEKAQSEVDSVGVEEEQNSDETEKIVNESAEVSKTDIADIEEKAEEVIKINEIDEVAEIKEQTSEDKKEDSSDTADELDLF